MLRSLKPLLWFFAAFFITIFTVLSAYASTATIYGKNITFDGNQCSSLLTSISRTRYSIYGSTAGYVVFDQCGVDPIPPSSTVAIYCHVASNNNAPCNDTVAIGTIDDSAPPGTVDPNEAGYLGFIGAALSLGIGLIAGLQR